MLLAVLYGAYVALNGSDTPLPRELEGELDIEGPGGLSGTSFPPAAQPSPTFGVAPRSNPFQSSGSNLSNNTSPPPLSSNSPSILDTSEPLGTPSLPQPTTLPASPGLAKPSSLPGSSSALTGNNISSPSEVPSLPDLSSPAFNNGAPKLSLPDQHGSNISNLNEATKEDRMVKAPDLPTMLDPNSEANEDPVGVSDLGDATSASAMNTSSRSFANAKKMAVEQFQRGELKEALSTLSLFYNVPELTHEQHHELLELLDPLAGEVIYSRRHLLENAHVVAQGETLDAIAKQYEVPSEILARINGIENPLLLQPATRMKVVRGPFRGEIDLTRSELTLFLGELYAGRFAIATGEDPSPKEGPYQVVEKQQKRNYYGRGGTQISGADPKNPYGGWWIDLGQDICIHGSPEQPNVETEKLGCISLSPIDARDVFGMLSRGSKIQIRR